MIRRLFAPLLVVALALPLRGAEEENRLANGGFDEGPPGATLIPGWTEVDGLTTFFVSAPDRGRVLLIDTDVNLTEADARWEEMALPREKRPPPKPKGPTKPPKYDTVGGTTGAKIYSDYIRIEPGMRYRLRVDAKTEAPEILVFVKGYAQFQGGFRKYYQCYKKIPSGETEWKTFERTFHPTLHSPEVTHIRVMPYAYWPPGRAFIDNIEVIRNGKETGGPPEAGTNLLANGDFEAEEFTPFTATGDVARVVRGTEGACVRIAAGSALASPAVEVEEGRRYVLTARVRPEGAILATVVEMLVRFEGKNVALSEARSTTPPDADGWIDVEIPFHPTKETPQVTSVRARFEVNGEKGSVLLDDVALSPAKK